MSLPSNPGQQPAIDPTQGPGLELSGQPGWDANNIIVGGTRNELLDCRRCSVIGGSNNKLFGRFNTHIIGDNVGNFLGMQEYGPNPYWLSGYTPTWKGWYDSDVKDNTLYVSLSGGIDCLGPIKTTLIEARGDIIAFTTSDERLKENVSLISNCLESILSLDPITFTWGKNQSTYSGEDIGLLAQQVEKVAPEIVRTSESGIKSMKYERVVPLLVGSIREQQQKIKSLEERILNLEKIITRS